MITFGSTPFVLSLSKGKARPFMVRQFGKFMAHHERKIGIAMPFVQSTPLPFVLSCELVELSKDYCRRNN